MHPQRSDRNLDGPFVDIDAKEVVVEDGGADLFGRLKNGLFLVHRVQEVEGLEQEMTRAASRVQEGQFGGSFLQLGPSGRPLSVPGFADLLIERDQLRKNRSCRRVQQLVAEINESTAFNARHFGRQRSRISNDVRSEEHT